MILDTLNKLDSEEILRELNAPKSKSAASSALTKLKIPNKKSEKYRYFDIESLMQNRWDNFITTTNISRQKSGKKIVIEDGNILSVTDTEGIAVELTEFEDFDIEHFDALYFLNHLLAPKIIVIRCSKDASFEIEHIINKNGSLINYRVAIFIDKNIDCQIFNTIKGEAKESFVLSGYDIFISRDASLKFVKNQTLKSNSYTPIFTSRYKVDSNANLKLGTFDFVKANGLNIFRAKLGENANIDLSHLLYSANNSTKFGTVSEIVHAGKCSHSNQIAKNILDNNSCGIFDALIRVEDTSKYTKAHQNSKAVLLNSGAYMASKPQLEIYIDDLEASHGSTIGQLDEQALFYLRSRGIAEQEARKMLILAFASEVIATIDDEYIEKKVYTEFENAYYGIAELECIKTCNICENIILGETDGDN